MFAGEELEFIAQARECCVDRKGGEVEVEEGVLPPGVRLEVGLDLGLGVGLFTSSLPRRISLLFGTDSLNIDSGDGIISEIFGSSSWGENRGETFLLRPRLPRLDSSPP